MCIKPCTVHSIFDVNVQTHDYNSHPHHFADEIKHLPLDDELGPVSSYGVEEAFSWKNTHWNYIIFDKYGNILKLDTNKPNHSQ